MDRLDAMSVLLAAVRAGSLSAAARELGKPLTTISRKVADLERHLNARLLVRSSRRLALTDAGRSYVQACQRILDDVTEAERAATGEYTEPKGDLVITAPVVFGRRHVLPVVVDFLRAYPAIDIQLMLADRIVRLLDDHIDLAVRIGDLPDSQMVAVGLGQVQRVVCGSPAYFGIHGVPATPQALSGHACITFDNLHAPDSWRFAANGADDVVSLHSRLVVNTAEAAIDAAVAGLGITRLLSYQIDEERRDGRLQVVLQDWEPATVPVSLVYGSRRLLPLKLRAFLDFAKPRLRAALG